MLSLLDSEKSGKLSPLSERLTQSFSGAPAERVQAALQLLGDWCVQVNATPERRRLIEGWVSFERPETLHFDQLVQITRPETALPEVIEGPAEHLRLRDGFQLTDPRMTRKEYLREVDYCIICHPREKDSCSHGFHNADGTRKPNPLGIPLTGCPLEERISEMHALRKRGQVIASLAMPLAGVSAPACCNCHIAA